MGLVWGGGEIPPAPWLCGLDSSFGSPYFHILLLFIIFIIISYYLLLFNIIYIPSGEGLPSPYPLPWTCFRNVSGRQTGLLYTNGRSLLSWSEIYATMMI